MHKRSRHRSRLINIANIAPHTDLASSPPDRVRRNFLKSAGALMTILVSPVGPAFGSQETQILAVRVWPANDYTRVTLEGKNDLRFTHFMLKNPERLVVDLEGVEFNSVLASLPEKILESDPYIKLIRAGRNRPGIVRLVIELKNEIQPQLFTLKPVGEYGHRLVLDLYPSIPQDPMLALLDKKNDSESKTSDAAPSPYKKKKG